MVGWHSCRKRNYWNYYKKKEFEVAEGTELENVRVFQVDVKQDQL